MNKGMILVTGIPRSGTTAIGNILASPKKINSSSCVLYEPLNPEYGIKEIKKRFYTPGKLKEEGLIYVLENIINLKFRVETKFNVGSAHKNMNLIKYFIHRYLKLNFNYLSYFHSRYSPFIKNIIWKDPDALLLSNYISKTFNIPVVIMLKSPFALASSYRRMGWWYNIEGLLYMVNKKSYKYELADKGFYINDKNLLDNSMMFFYIIYNEVLKMKMDNENLIIVDLDSILDSGIEGYKNLFRYLDLPFTKEIDRSIQIKFSGKRKTVKDNKVHDFKRDSKSIRNRYLNDLTKGEIERIEDLNMDLYNKLKHLAILC